MRQFRADGAGVGWTWQRDPLSPWRSVPPGRIEKHCLPLGGVGGSDRMMTCHGLHSQMILRQTLATKLGVGIGGVLLCCRPHTVIEGVFLGEWSGSHSRQSTCVQEVVAPFVIISYHSVGSSQGEGLQPLRNWLWHLWCLAGPSPRPGACMQLWVCVASLQPSTWMSHQVTSSHTHSCQRHKFTLLDCCCHCVVDAAFSSSFAVVDCFDRIIAVCCWCCPSFL